MLKSGGIGLAAPQVGLSRKLMIVWDGDPARKMIVMCNPEIVSYGPYESTFIIPLQKGPEGCLSFPNLVLEVERHETVCIRYQNLKGKFERLEADGLLARCIQHEMDHLNGVLFIDYKEKQNDTESGDSSGALS